ncbi:hypothetical protein ABIE67_008565 [Streptomyces sp. V4I8]
MLLFHRPLLVLVQSVRSDLGGDGRAEGDRRRAGDWRQRVPDG